MHSLREIMASGILMLKEFTQPERIVGKKYPWMFFGMQKEIEILMLGELAIIKHRSLVHASQRCS